MNLLEVTDLTLAFGGITALDKISFQAEQGRITAIIGPNGAGKTSFFNVISGFYRARAGRVTLDGRDISGLPPHRRPGLGIARTFQNIALFQGMTVLDNIKLGAHTRLSAGPIGAGFFIGRPRREEAELAAAIHEQVIGFLKLDMLGDKEVQDLPYGLQKRVELARALVARPRLLLLDEPVAGMNREEKQSMSRFILDIGRQWGTTILLIEHDMGMVMDLSDRVVVLNFGRNIATGTPDEVRRNPDVIRAYLGDAAPVGSAHAA